MAYKQVQQQQYDGSIFKFEEKGDNFEGTLVNIRRDVTTRNGLSDVADFLDMDGNPFSIFLTAGLKTRMDEKLKGERLLITYIGEMTNEKTGRKFKAFDVAVWEDDSDEIPF
jgi:hypothetical protein